MKTLDIPALMQNNVVKINSIFGKNPCHVSSRTETHVTLADDRGHKLTVPIVRSTDKLKSEIKARRSKKKG